MLVLAVTASTDSNSVCILDGGRLLGHSEWSKGSKASEELTFHIRKILKQADLQAVDVKLLAVDRGPGSFTGCRMAVNAVKTLSFLNGCSIAVFDSLEIMAYPHAGKNKEILCHLDAHRNLFYVQKFGKDMKALHSRPITISKDLIQNHFTPGTIVIGPDSGFPDSRVLAKMALKSSESHRGTWRDLEPLYIRSPDAVEAYSKRMALE